ncbi:hypothetical protein NQ318_006534 [Aromia moschata]|uniref:Mos1 transposase HTH domain-containing protein n=1 Tax=Aromia moschata TaxID=1265417 RepID=A0AAV8YMB2_9CUCU|nr:hypothetical protein NQ318_006534 [Aromia moschata]
MLKEVYGNECLSRTHVVEWFIWFKEGRETTEDDPRPGRRSTSKTDENVLTVFKTLLGNPKDKIDNNEKSGIYEISYKDCDQKEYMYEVCKLSNETGKLAPDQATLWRLNLEGR